MIILGYVIALAYGIFCLLLSEICYKIGCPKIYTRKLVHILVGFEWVILYIFHGATVHFLVVCLLFLALLVFAAWKKIMPMISSDSDNSLGTVYYAVSMSIMAFVCIFFKELMIPFGIAVFCTSFGDGFAGVIGQAFKKLNPRVYESKTLFGVLANLLFSALTVGIFNYVFNLRLSLWLAACIVILAIELEMFTGHGLDNITLPLGVFVISATVLFIPNPTDYLLPFLITPLIIAVVSKKHLLSSAGIFAAFIIDAIISVSLGNFGFIILCAFFGLGVVTDKIKKLAKKQNNSSVEHCRELAQVLANSLVATVCALVFHTTGNYIFVVAFAASLAEALADTASSAFGVFSNRTYDIFKFNKTEQGLSGGMSIIGTTAALFFSALMGAICLAFGFNIKNFLIVCISAFFGTVFDSLLGSIFQVKYKCSVCNKIIESDTHCDSSAKYHSGIKRFDNNFVNLLSTAFAAIIAIIIFKVIA